MARPYSTHLCVIGVTIAFIAINSITAQQTTYPPLITAEYNYIQKIYEGGDSFNLPCVADGFPVPSYAWERNGNEFKPEGSNDAIVQQSGVGTLTFNNPQKQNEGFYKCLATNDFGTAVSTTVQLVFAVLNEFEGQSGRRITKTAGEKLRLICTRPSSLPEAKILWSKTTTTTSVYIDYNDRIVVDPDGGLNFAYVNNSDSGGYRCEAYNQVLRKTVKSPVQTLTVTGDLSSTRSPPQPNWTVRTSETFLRGEEARIKCIFSGKPVPGVQWRRSDGKDISVRAQIRSFGLELYFAGIEYEDAGAYECDGFNKAATNPYKQTVNVAVQGKMRWIHKPQPVTKGENETVTFECKGEGVPSPDLPAWFINGQEFTASSDRMIIGDQYGPSTTLTIKNLVKADTMALQCNITNYLIGSWVHTSFYLNVQSEPPIIERFDDGEHKWAAGQDKWMPCKVFGAPTPVISWMKNGQSLTGGRFVTFDNGTLHIKDVGITDAGTYECVATNTKGIDAKSAKVVVRRQTQIKQAPADLTVTAGTQAKFVCTALTDPDESQNLKISWLKDGSPMNYFENNRVYMNAQDNALQIAGPQSLDSGSYTCVASNGIDSASASATLRVQGRPDRPPIVSVEDCKSSGSAKVKWSPGTNNNAPLTNFIIQYQTALDESIWYTADDNIATGVTEQVVELKSNNRFSFRVMAQNKIGISDPSNPTGYQCTTDPARPALNPRGVRTLDEGDNKLVITWQPISEVDHGGSSFKYNIRYREADKDKCGAHEYCTVTEAAKEGTNGRPGELNIIEYKVEVPNAGVYTKYTLSVKTSNSVGESSVDAPFIIGYSGEGNPKQVVSGFRVNNNNLGEPMIYSDNATFIWDRVDESDVESQGFFRGYMIQYTKQVIEDTDEYFDTRSIYIVLRDVKKEGIDDIEERKLTENEYGAIEDEGNNTVSVTITHLPPNSELTFKISVINKRRYGTPEPFEGLTVNTKEGAPGPVQQLTISETGPTHVRLSWQRPLEPNGELTKYHVGFKTLDGLQLGPLQYPDLDYVDEPSDPDQKVISAKVTGLKPLQMYRFYVWAYTNAGQGSEYFIDDSTVAAGYPNAPSLNVERLSNSTLNVSWVPASDGVPANVFYVQYKQESAIDQWQRTGWETNNNWLMVDGFDDGWKYDIRVVASNGGIYETGSATESIFPTATSRSASEARQVFSSAWFIGLLIALILVSVFFIMLCLIQQNNGGIYHGQFAVEETERLRPYDDNAFDEKPPLRSDPVDSAPSERYAPSHFSDRYGPAQSEKAQSEKNSERWVGSQPPPHDEYMQDDPNRYGEEGSFIGQYRENKELPNFRPRTQQSEPYRPPQQPTPRSRGPPSESAYWSGPPVPVPQPRDGYQPRGSGPASQPQRPPPRQPRAAPSQSAAPSYNDYAPAQYRPAPAAAADYTPNTRYRPVTTPSEPENEANDTVV